MSKERIAVLDGWRGIAILLVLFDHLQLAFANSYHYIRPWTETGRHGVTIFFVLSGYLITSKLLSEEAISLKRFYIRRVFRLMPVAWTYLIVLILLTRLTHVPLTSFSEIRACLLFYRNFLTPLNYGLASHFWSLSVEEQFYLVWPALLLVFGVERCRWIAVFGACAGGIYKLTHWNDNFQSTQTQLHADAILIGCLLAMTLSDPALRRVFQKWSKWLVVPAFITMLFCMLRFHDLSPLSESISIAALIGACVLSPASFASRVLSFRPLTWTGVVSYSIYVWQEPFMQIKGHYQIFFLCVIMPVVILVSHYCIERPLTQYGARLARSRQAQQTCYATNP
jgi:peptidoglycan/LPS O-acetylase OafA/YrhL